MKSKKSDSAIVKECSISSEQKNKSGITLIVLVITVVVLLILAGVAVKLSLGENGIIERAKSAIDKYGQSAVKEQTELAKYENELVNSGTRGLTDEQINNMINTAVEKKLMKHFQNMLKQLI